MNSTQNDFITVVSGPPRSGTSMMMQMLDKGGIPILTDNVRTADDDNPKGYYEFEPVKRTKKDASWVDLAVGKAVKAIHALLQGLPPHHNYRVIFMKRKLEEVVASQDVMLERRGKAGGKLSPDQLIKTFEKQLGDVQNWLKDQPNFQVLYVDYNELIKDPAPAVEAVNRFLGGGLDTAAMTAVADPSLYRQRK